MMLQDIKSHLRPFEPFRLTTSAGETYDIRSPDLIMVGVGSVIIGIPPKPDDDFFERTVRISLFHVVKIEPLSTPGKGNGPAMT